MVSVFDLNWSPELEGRRERHCSSSEVMLMIFFFFKFYFLWKKVFLLQFSSGMLHMLFIPPYFSLQRLSPLELLVQCLIYTSDKLHKVLFTAIYSELNMLLGVWYILRKHLLTRWTLLIHKILWVSVNLQWHLIKTLQIDLWSSGI